jgi:hypothetical protein
LLKNTNSKIALGSIPVGIFAILFVVGFAPLQALDNSDAAVFGGEFTFTHRDSAGNIIEQFTVENEVTNEGMECVADLIFFTTDCTGETDFAWIALGTSNAAVDETDTALTTEVGGCTRLEDATIALDTGTTNQRTATVSVTFSGAGCEGSAFAEVGLFDAVTTGNMLARALISPTINLGSGDTLQIDYDIVLNNS